MEGPGRGEGGREGWSFFSFVMDVFHAMGSFKINVTLWGVGGVNFPDKKHYE